MPAEGVLEYDDGVAAAEEEETTVLGAATDVEVEAVVEETAGVEVDEATSVELAEEDGTYVALVETAEEV